MAVITGLPFLGCVDAEQPHELTHKLHGIPIYDLKSRLWNALKASFK